MLSSAVILMLGAGIIHLAGTPARLSESPMLGGGTAVLGLAQVALAAALVIVPGRRLTAAAAVVQMGAVLVWAVGHTAGLPVGPTVWRPEPLSIPDLFLPALEVLATLALIGAMWRARRAAPGRRSWRRIGLALIPTIALMAILVGGGAQGAPADTLAAGRSGDARAAGGPDHHRHPTAAPAARRSRWT
jgi:hypothetical protein